MFSLVFLEFFCFLSLWSPKTKKHMCFFGLCTVLTHQNHKIHCVFGFLGSMSPKNQRNSRKTKENQKNLEKTKKTKQSQNQPKSLVFCFFFWVFWFSRCVFVFFGFPRVVFSCLSLWSSKNKTTSKKWRFFTTRPKQTSKTQCCLHFLLLR